MKWAQLTLGGKLLRVASIAAIAGVIWALHGYATAEDMGPIVYLLFWIPVMSAIVVTFWLASGWCVRLDLEGGPRAERRLLWFVHVLFFIGIVALVGEAMAIVSEGKKVQAFELVAFSAGLVVFRWWIHTWRPAYRQRMNELLIGGLAFLGVAWFAIMDTILALFDRP